MKYFALLLSAICLFTDCLNKSTSVKEDSDFVKVENGKLVIDGQPYRFKGTNYWYACNLATSDSGKARLCRELDSLKSSGINNLRVQFCSEGNYCYTGNNLPSLQPELGKFNEEMFKAGDFFLSEIAKRDIKAVIILNNYWFWSGGMPWYVSKTTGQNVPVPDDKPGAWDKFMAFSDLFYETDTAQNAFKQTIKTVINRINSITGIAYKDDRSIMAWQLANEPRNGKDSLKQAAMMKWVFDASAYIKSLDTNHLVSIGTEGEAGHWFNFKHWININTAPGVDYVTIHLWPQNWSWFDPKRASQTMDSACNLAQEYLSRHIAAADSLNKPSVIEEFGMARDNGNFSMGSPCIYRDKFLDFVLNFAQSNFNNTGLAGINFWGWSGEAAPKNPGKNWSAGEPLSGDPPHEIQGWYGIYNSDTSTLNVIRKYNFNGEK